MPAPAVVAGFLALAAVIAGGGYLLIEEVEDVGGQVVTKVKKEVEQDIHQIYNDVHTIVHNAEDGATKIQSIYHRGVHKLEKDIETRLTPTICTNRK